MEVIDVLMQVVGNMPHKVMLYASLIGLIACQEKVKIQ